MLVIEGTKIVVLYSRKFYMLVSKKYNIFYENIQEDF